MTQSTCAVMLFSLLVPSMALAQSSAEREVLPLIHEQRLAANAHDTDRFLATYLHAPTLVFVIDGRIIRGFDNLRDQQLKWWSDGKSDVVYTELAAPEFLRLGDNSVLVTEQLASRRTGPDGKPAAAKFAVTSVWQHVGEGWLVTYAHESWPR
jgi:ketosteroid isomerase-like protein